MKITLKYYLVYKKIQLFAIYSYSFLDKISILKPNVTCIIFYFLHQVLHYNHIYMYIIYLFILFLFKTMLTNFSRSLVTKDI
jgi:hypothetical protein